MHSMTKAYMGEEGGKEGWNQTYWNCNCEVNMLTGPVSVKCRCEIDSLLSMVHSDFDVFL